MPTPAAPDVPLLHALELTPFVDQLPLPQRIHAGKNRLRITMREIKAKAHRDLPATRMWSYSESALGPLIEARSHVPFEIEWINALPQQHFLPIDYTLHGCGHDVPEVRAVAHMHGACVRPEDDGGPESWFTPGQSRVNRYPMQQDAATLWYHDHAMGLNRLNVYAGLIGMMLIRDAEEDALHLPAAQHELPLVFYDRNFTTNGQLHYPVSDDPEHPWVSEFNADALLVNGKIRPFIQIEPVLYRLRLLNAANSRFLRLSFGPETQPGAAPQPLSFAQIGSDQGLLASPVPLDVLSLAPGERADLLVDFTKLAGQTLYLINGALEIVQLRIGHTKPTPAPARIHAVLRHIERIPPSSAARARRITLNEYKDTIGRSMIMLLNRKHWHEPVTETPKLNSVEIWEFINLTEDTHPMHLHLVRFQVLDRRVFDRFAYLTRNELVYTAAATAPAANEMGWKDVVQCSAASVTRIIVRFEGYTGKYLYHCHVLEHEANDMMRPYEIM